MVEYVKEQPFGSEPVPAVPKREFTRIQTAAAWVSALCGYGFCRVFPVAESPFGGWLFLVLLFGGAWGLAMVQKRPLRGMTVIATVAALLVGGGLLLCANAFLHTLAYSYALATWLYVVYRLFTAETAASGFRRVAADYFKALIILPFCSFGCLFGALFSGKMKVGGKQIGRVLLGVALAIIPTATVIGLLSYDDGFSDLLGQLFDWDIETVLSHIGSLLLAVPLGMYTFGLFISAADGKGDDVMTADGCARATKAVRIAPMVTVAAAGLPLLFVYAVFFLSQWDYYMSAFTGVLPQGFNHADYAREGFFQLCAVAVINLAVVVAATVFMKRRDDGKSVFLIVLVTLFSTGTWLLIATAISKMMLYIDRYGLTPRRVYATWFMAVIALAFLVLTLGQFVRKLPTFAVCIAVMVVMFAGLSLCSTDTLIARYNVERYLDGTLKTVDMDAMEELGDAAVPSLVVLVTELDEQNGTDIAKPGQSALKSKNETYAEVARYLAHVASVHCAHDDSLWEWTLPKYRAENALKSVGLLKE